MANGLNRAILCGALGADPELKFTQGGQAVLRMRLATGESYLSKDGKKQERTEWHTIVVWGKRAEGLNRVLTKGSKVWVEGKIQTRSWEDREGGKRYATEIVAQNLGLLGGGSGQGAGGGRRNDRQDGGGFGDDYDGGFSGGDDYPADDDIPF